MEKKKVERKLKGIHIPISLHQKLRIIAAQRAVPLYKLALELIERALKGEKTGGERK